MTDVLNDLLSHLFAALAGLVNPIADILLKPIGTMSGWLSNTIVSAVAGVGLLIIFKYTSNQRAIGRVRDAIKANMLALKLYKDEFSVTARSQAAVFGGAFRLLFHSIVPLMVMMVPVILLLGQLGLWYQHSPLRPQTGETIVTMQLADSVGSDDWPDVRLEPSEIADVVIGPVRIISERQICWKIRARESGCRDLVFTLDSTDSTGDETVTKQLVVGDGVDLVAISPRRPGWKWISILMNPHERPFADGDVVQGISIEYPPRNSWNSGSDWWVGYFFVASMAFALLFKPFLKVRI